MKIGIEAQRLFRLKKHGMEVVALELIRALQKIDKENEYVIFVKEDVDNSCLNLTDNFKVKVLPKSPYPIWEQYVLPKAIKKENINLLHCTANTGPLNISIPLVLTLHDIIYLESVSFNGSVYQNFGNLYRRWVVPKVVKKCKRIITVSDFERKRIAEYFNFNFNSLESVYNGKNEEFKLINDLETRRKILNKYGLPSEFILFFGNTAPKKNTYGTLKGYLHYYKNTTDPIPLVITDCTQEFINGILEDLKASEIKNNVLVRDYVSFSDIPVVYNVATLFLYPSLRESFGMPIIESMACGTPVITSDTSSMPEVSGDAAVLIDPYKPEQIGVYIGEILKNKKQYNQLINKGLQRAKDFDWEVTAQSVLNIYNSMSIN